MTSVIGDAAEGPRARKIWRRWGWAISIAAGFIAPVALVLVLTLDGAGYPGIGVPEPVFSALGVVLVFWFVLQSCALIGWVGRQIAGRWAGAALLFGMGVLLGLIPAVIAGFASKLLVAEILAARAQSVIAAVEAFHAARGGWPADLDQLVPEYLAETPRTGRRSTANSSSTLGIGPKSLETPGCSRFQ